MSKEYEIHSGRRIVKTVLSSSPLQAAIDHVQSYGTPSKEITILGPDTVSWRGHALERSPFSSCLAARTSPRRSLSCPHRGSQCLVRSADGNRRGRSPGSTAAPDFCLSEVCDPGQRRYCRQAAPPLDTGSAALGKMCSSPNACAPKG